MKYIYEFADEEKLTCEVTEELAAVLEEMDRVEHTNDVLTGRHSLSLEEMDYEGEAFGICDEYEFMRDDDDDPEVIARRVHAAFATLTDVQKRRLLLYAAGKTYREIGALEAVDGKTAYESIESARKKFKKYF